VAQLFSLGGIAHDTQYEYNQLRTATDSSMVSLLYGYASLDFVLDFIWTLPGAFSRSDLIFASAIFVDRWDTLLAVTRWRWPSLVAPQPSDSSIAIAWLQRRDFTMGYYDTMKMPPNKSPEPTAVGAVSSAVAVHVASRRWLSLFR
jgi:hypothetical protein